MLVFNPYRINYYHKIIVFSLKNPKPNTIIDKTI